MKNYLLVKDIYDESFLAKPDESLKLHTEWVLKEAKELFSLYGSFFTEKEKTLILTACLVHDYGKINKVFQQKIRNPKEREADEIYHNFLSPMFLNFEALKQDFTEDEIKDLVTAVANHHVRNYQKKSDLRAYLEQIFKENIWQCFKIDMNISTRYLTYLWFTQENVGCHYPKNWGSYAKLRGILQKCDYAGSAHIENLEIMDRTKRKEFLKNIQKSFELNDLQQFLFQNSQKNVVAVAPTGIGKTEGSFLWLGEDKGFYTLPLRVASNAIFYRANKNYQYDEVTILHSNTLDILAKEGLEDQFEATKRLSYPLTITTVDQLFKFPFQTIGHELLFATLTYSKVVIDEIQMYSSTILACLFVGLKYIVEQGGKFLITTATLPPIFKDYLKKYIGEENFLDYQFPLQNQKKRHLIKLCTEEFQYDLIIEQALENKVLVICNTIKKAQVVYKRLQEKTSNVFLLHSAFIKKDRQEKEEQIMNFKENGIWVTTQIVEASLDIDFDILHTDMALIDNIFQRMGRCYRKREYQKTTPNIYIYDSKEGVREIKRGFYDKVIYQMSIEELRKYDNKLLSEEDKQQMIENIYTKERLKKTAYLKELNNKLENLENTYPGRYTEQTTDDLFRDIYNETVIPEQVYQEYQTEIDDLIKTYHEAKGIQKMKLKSKLLDYSVQIPYYRKEFISGSIIKGLQRALITYDKNLGVTYERYDDQFG